MSLREKGPVLTHSWVANTAMTTINVPLKHATPENELTPITAVTDKIVGFLQTPAKERGIPISVADHPGELIYMIAADASIVKGDDLQPDATIPTRVTTRTSGIKCGEALETPTIVGQIILCRFYKA